MTPSVRFAATVVTLLVLGACGSTQIAERWKDPSFAGPPLRGVFVVSMAPSDVGRRGSEDVFAAALARHGVAATPSYSLFPGALPDDAALRRRIERAGYDGVLLITPGGAETHSTWVPGTAVRVGHVGFWGHYRTNWGVVVRPGYRVRERIVLVETTVWKLGGDDSLIWGATTETANPSSREALGTDVSEAIADRLAADGVI
jgi:hypothetical protein